MFSYKDRLAAALAHAQVTDTQLAKKLDVSIQAVRKIAAGTTAAFTAENNSKAARFLGVSPDWLATGEGEMVSASRWPGTQLTLEQITKWPAELIKSVEDFALFQLRQTTDPVPDDSQASNNDVTIKGARSWKLPLDIKPENQRGGKNTPATSVPAKKRSGGRS